MLTNVDQLLAAVLALRNAEKAEHSSRFFKTGPGQYGEGDQFLGLTVPQQRVVAGQFWKTTSLADIAVLLKNPFHEVRLTALLVLVKLSQKHPERLKEYVDFYLQHSQAVNNWDLVNCSAEHIVGAWVLRHPSQRKLLFKLADSKLLWDRRIAVVATFALLKQGESAELFALTDQLMDDKHDLMHKAVGWMLRELGKRNWGVVETFLRNNLTHNGITKPRYQWLPRTTLRYCLERQPKSDYQAYLTGKMTALS